MNRVVEILLLAAATIVLVLFPQVLAAVILTSGILLFSFLLFKALKSFHRAGKSVLANSSKKTPGEILEEEGIRTLNSELSDRKFSSESIEDFINELGSALDADLMEDVEINKKVSKPDLSFKERMENNFSPVYEVRRNNETVTEISGSFPKEDNLSDFNKHFFQNRDTDKRIHILPRRKTAVLSEKEVERLESRKIRLRLPGETF